ncbi:hypothetical protein QDR37_00985 [Amnibacterium sp. CER49]|uniref:hypothetical protein n=1 Tax=Amnibacterium sp. CER49 TaxID=3039161 RepID=UPI00244D73DA|nr:hypothetical protein [Amnibacterium sp. CER49]MDH2442510.1 hypothetical protein [Amnibacterium sp. CER49]
MRLGTRWGVGQAAPGTLPEAMRASIRAVEEELRSAGQDTRGWGWTLTYLEDRPLVDLDDGTRVRMVPGEDAALITSVELDTAED